MATIHKHSVSYDESSHSLRSIAYYLEYTLSRDKAEELFNEAKNSSSAKAHFSGPDGGHYKLKRENGQYTLFKSDNY